MSQILAYSSKAKTSKCIAVPVRMGDHSLPPKRCELTSAATRTSAFNIPPRNKYIPPLGPSFSSSHPPSCLPLILGGVSKTCFLFTDGSKLSYHWALVSYSTGHALPGQGGWVHGCVGLYRQQSHAVGYLNEQSFQNYQVGAFTEVTSINPSR